MYGFVPQPATQRQPQNFTSGSVDPGVTGTQCTSSPVLSVVFYASSSTYSFHKRASPCLTRVLRQGEFLTDSMRGLLRDDRFAADRLLAGAHGAEGSDAANRLTVAQHLEVVASVGREAANANVVVAAVAVFDRVGSLR